MRSEETITSKEAATLAGCTYRQLDYWIRNRAIPATDAMFNVGQGTVRRIPVWYVPRLRLLARMQRTFFGVQQGFPSWVLLEIFEQYNQGVAEFSGLRITWEVEDGSEL